MFRHLGSEPHSPTHFFWEYPPPPPPGEGVMTIDSYLVLHGLKSDNCPSSSGCKIACIASVSMQQRAKKRDFRRFARAKNGARTKIRRGWGRGRKETLAAKHCDSSLTFSVRPCSSVGRVTVDLIRRSWVRFPPRSKDFFFASCGSLFRFNRANAQWVIHGFK